MSIADPLPAPQPPDPPAIRPALNLSHMLQQVRGIQTYLASLGMVAAQTNHKREIERVP